MRFTLGKSGALIDADGATAGRVVALEIDLDMLDRDGTVSERSERYGDLVVSSSSITNVKGKETPFGGKEERPTPSQLEAAAIGRVWAYYLEVVPSRRKLDEKRRRMIRNALRLVGEDATRQAILGLSRSPHHNGVNEQRRSYLELRYALKGIGNESDDERIEKAIAWVAIYGDGSSAAIDEVKVQRWLDEVRYTLSLPHRPERDRGLRAHANLIAAGFEVVKLDKAPWARVKR